MKIKKNYSYSGYLYILPWILGFLLLQLVPLVNSFWYSFTNFQLLGKAQFLGLDNYKKIFLSDAVFRQSLKVTFYYVLIAVPLKIAFALVIAIILNQNIKGINLFRTLYYIPSILGGSVAISVLWKYLFMNQGVVNNIIGRFGSAPSTGSGIRASPSAPSAWSPSGSSARRCCSSSLASSRFRSASMKRPRSMERGG